MKQTLHYAIGFVLLFTSTLAYSSGLVGLMVPKLDGPALFEALQSGGHVIYFRHGITERVKEAPDENDLSNCSVQRNLSAEGVEQTKAFGAAFKAKNIPIGQVFSSPYCRCRDSAQNIAGKDPVIDPYLAWPINVAPEQLELYIGELKKLLSIPPAKGTNTILVSHTSNLQFTVNLRPKKEGDAFVFKPLEDGFEYVGHIAPDGW